MIEVIKGRIRWSETYSNPPGLELLVSRIPKLEEHRFERRGSCYYSELDGLCSFFSWDGRPDHGYGGRAFTLRMLDGSTEELVGPWSSSCSAMNSLGFGPCTEVAATDEPDAYERGYTFYASAITMGLLGTARDRIEVPPYRFRIDEPHRSSTLGFSHRLVFPEGSRFTMVQTDLQGESTKGPVRMDMRASAEQGLLLGGNGQRFVPVIELPGGGYWLKPRSCMEPVPVPDGCRVEEVESKPGFHASYIGVPT